ncbi:ras gtpase-related [Anaeramoeba flamelloides]|uniref:Ras gtpase-related n=1 Tax=Anaeramoeba flamelloides TaxID=1746091 RepID=A0AAV7ZU55_9EUKA|nr:ras gtpase-related [Anaeramoeba flamelloides]
MGQEESTLHKPTSNPKTSNFRVAILGPHKCGKSTLFYSLIGSRSEKYIQAQKTQSRKGTQNTTQEVIREHEFIRFLDQKNNLHITCELECLDPEVINELSYSESLHSNKTKDPLQPILKHATEDSTNFFRNYNGVIIVVNRSSKISLEFLRRYTALVPPFVELLIVINFLDEKQIILSRNRIKTFVSYLPKQLQQKTSTAFCSFKKKIGLEAIYDWFVLPLFNSQIRQLIRINKENEKEKEYARLDFDSLTSQENYEQYLENYEKKRQFLQEKRKLLKQQEKEKHKRKVKNQLQYGNNYTLSNKESYSKGKRNEIRFKTSFKNNQKK